MNNCLSCIQGWLINEVGYYIIEDLGLDVLEVVLVTTGNTEEERGLANRQFLGGN